MLLLLAMGDREGLGELVRRAEGEGLNNLAFVGRWEGGDVGGAVDLLVRTGRGAEGALLARTYAPRWVLISLFSLHPGVACWMEILLCLRLLFWLAMLLDLRVFLRPTLPPHSLSSRFFIHRLLYLCLLPSSRLHHADCLLSQSRTKSTRSVESGPEEQAKDRCVCCEPRREPGGVRGGLGGGVGQRGGAP